MVFRKPSRQLLALGLVYGPMSIAGFLTGRLFFGNGPLAAGQTLLGTLPTDVSSPLLVLMARGNVALAAVFNAVNTALSPFIVPFVFLWLTGIQLEVPLGAIIFELALIVLVPTVVGVSLRTGFPDFFASFLVHILRHFRFFFCFSIAAVGVFNYNSICMYQFVYTQF